MGFKRLFIAIDIPTEIKSRFTSLKDQFNHPAIRWVPNPNLHVTLHFIGKTDKNDIPEIMNEIQSIAEHCNNFELVSNSPRLIKKRRKPIMIWAGFQPNASFTNLVKELQNVLPGDDNKEPKPHITLARINPKKNPPDLTCLPKLGPYNIAVDQIELWESALRNSHPVYKCLKTFTFNQKSN